MHKHRIISGSLSCAIALALGGCSFDRLSIGVVDPNDDDGFGGYVPPHERARWEVPVWERPPAEEDAPSESEPTEGDDGGG